MQGWNQKNPEEGEEGLPTLGVAVSKNLNKPAVFKN